MVSLGFNVVGQLLSATDGVFLANNTVNVLRCDVSFDNSWSGLDIFALFAYKGDYYRVIPTVSDGVYSFSVPQAVLVGTGFYFTLYGVPTGEDTVTSRLTTNKVHIRLAESGFTADAKDTSKPLEKTVKIVWVDDDDSKGLRPEYVTGWLNRDSVPYKGVVLTDDVDWEHTDELMDTGTGTTVFAYDLQVLDDYAQSSNVTGDLTTVTYTIKKDVTVKIVWVDNDDSRGIRPSSVNVNLLADGSNVKTVTLNNSNSWEHTETRLDPTKTYTWTIPTVLSYNGSSSVDGDLTTITYTIQVTPPTPGGK